jgi:hypothetical protein
VRIDGLVTGYPCTTDLPPPPMPLPRQLLEEMRVTRAAQAEQAHRDTMWSHVRTVVACLAWCALGLCLVMWSAHTTDVGYGRVAFFAGLIVGNGGILFALTAAYARGERRGDW